MAQATAEKLQALLDNSGINVVKINIEESRPPTGKAAYDDVIKPEDLERLVKRLRPIQMALFQKRVVRLRDWRERPKHTDHR